MMYFFRSILISTNCVELNGWYKKSPLFEWAFCFIDVDFLINWCWFLINLGIGSLTMSYFHMRMHTIIGAKAFHGPVRDGKGWYHLAMVVRQKGLTVSELTSLETWRFIECDCVLMFVLDNFSVVLNLIRLISLAVAVVVLNAYAYRLQSSRSCIPRRHLSTGL